MTNFFITFGVFALSILLLLLGYFISGRSVKGSCGGINCCSKSSCETDQSKK